MAVADHTVRRATGADAGAITRILAASFHDDPPLMWIIPDAADRQRLSPAFFRPFVDLVLTGGEAYMTDQGTGVSLWLDVDVDAPDEDASGDFEGLLVDGIAVEYAKRFFVLDELFNASHPTDESHAYLAFAGVVPRAQRQGVGTALIMLRLAALDAAGRPAYLEASCPRNAALYARLGFAPLGEPIAPPDGPPLQPMWRPAAG